jgi:hypothetical protein
MVVLLLHAGRELVFVGRHDLNKVADVDTTFLPLLPVLAIVPQAVECQIELPFLPGLAKGASLHEPPLLDQPWDRTLCKRQLHLRRLLLQVVAASASDAL